MKKIICSVFAILLVFTTVIPICAAQQVTVVFDGAPLEFDVPPQIINGRVMVPIRALFEALGADMEWEQSTRTATATADDYVVKCTVGSKILTFGNEKIEMDIAPTVIDGRTLMSVRYAAQAFDCDVMWIDATKTALIHSMNFMPAEGGTSEQ